MRASMPTCIRAPDGKATVADCPSRARAPTMMDGARRAAPPPTVAGAAAPDGVSVELYLMRHGEAEAGASDAARRLTAEGAAAVERVAARAAAAGVRLDRVYHSGLVRAEQTALILARHLGTT